jgi:ABC-type antimicrobial peptide transport system permease subunit
MRRRVDIVGSIAFSGVLAINALERRHEIGVLRAIGASSRAIAGLFVGEGSLLGWLSWLLALPLNIPAGQLILRSLGAALGGTGLQLHSQRRADLVRHHPCISRRGQLAACARRQPDQYSWWVIRRSSSEFSVGRERRNER